MARADFGHFLVADSLRSGRPARSELPGKWVGPIGPPQEKCSKCAPFSLPLSHPKSALERSFLHPFHLCLDQHWQISYELTKKATLWKRKDYILKIIWGVSNCFYYVSKSCHPCPRPHAFLCLSGTYGDGKLARNAWKYRHARYTWPEGRSSKENIREEREKRRRRTEEKDKAEVSAGRPHRSFSAKFNKFGSYINRFISFENRFRSGSFPLIATKVIELYLKMAFFRLQPKSLWF